MRFLTTEDTGRLLDVTAVIEALRTGYDEYRDGRSAQIPRVDLLAPAETGTAHRFGVMAGVSRAFDVAVVRIKSDVVTWAGGREDKHAARPGRYSGTVIAFRVSDGAPLAIVQDGVVQHLRVAGAAALGTDLMAPAPVRRMAILGSGGMAGGIAAGMAVLRDPPERIAVYSPDPGHREAFRRRLAELGAAADVVAVTGAEAAVRGADLVVSATNSLEPTVDPGWLEPDVHVTAVSRREVSGALRETADVVACLGPSSLDPSASPGMELTRGGTAAFAAFTEEERAVIPPVRPGDVPGEHPLMLEGVPWERRPRPATTVLTAVGTQGIQFASTIGLLLRRAAEEGSGTEVPDALFLHDVRT
jgi:ornithine cyclodeaminase/alanine dehydrogenase-like protein (mu-crystallin family)